MISADCKCVLRYYSKLTFQSKENSKKKNAPNNVDIEFYIYQIQCKEWQWFNLSDLAFARKRLGMIHCIRAPLHTDFRL